MENEELDNELIVNDSVPETLQENEQIETDASKEVEDVQETTNEVEQPQRDIEREIEERANKIAEEKIEARLIRDRVKRERETNEKFSKYQELEGILKVGLGAKDLDDLIVKSSDFYKEQGINIPVIERKQSLNDRDAVVLAKADAQDIMKCGEKEMEYEANRIANIPKEKRTIRENTIFNELARELTIRQLKNKGYDTNVLNDEKFKEFSSHIVNKPITEVYDMYTKLNSKPVEKPASAGSAKNEVGKATETFSAERINNMTPQELMKYWNNPDFRKVAGLN